MRKRYGFVYVDRFNDGTGTLERKIKKSYYRFKEIIESVNVAEATAIAMALENGKSTDDRYAVIGLVDSIAIEYSEQYHNISFFMTDDLDAPTFTFEAYRVACTDDQAPQIVIGAKVKVTAALQHYYKAATETLPEINLAETVAGGALEILEGPKGIENITLTDNAQKVLIDGVLYIVRDGKAFNAQGAQVR